MNKFHPFQTIIIFSGLISLSFILTTFSFLLISIFVSSTISINSPPVTYALCLLFKVVLVNLFSFLNFYVKKNNHLQIYY
nr:MAG TPA: hypothetical protein [Caudoviricetes sp.]